MAEHGKAALDVLSKVMQLAPSKNLFNPATRSFGVYVDHSTGALVSIANYDTSDFIPVIAGKMYAITACRKIAFFSSNKTVVSGGVDVSSVTPQVVTAPANSAYMKVTFATGAILTSQVEQGSAQTQYQAYGSDNGYQATGKLKVPIDSVSGLVNGTPGKNIFNSATRITGFLVDHNSGALQALAGYETSDFIPVTAGQNYAITACRKIVFFTSNQSYNSGIDVPTGQAQVVTAPANGYVRVSFPSSAISTSQIEQGSAQTSYQPYMIASYSLVDGVRVPASSVDGLSGASTDLTITKTGELFNVTSDFDGTNTITIETSRNGSSNQSFNFLRTRIGTTMIHDNSDDIAPIRTFSTVGANHGYPCVVKITMSGHGKTSSDLGSQWTDGLKTYTLLVISGNDLTFGCPYTVTNGVVSATLVNPTQNLTHVSGATNTAAVNITTIVAGAQLYPSTNNKSVKYVLDGKEITADGTYTGKELKVFESYNVMGYKDIIDYAQTHIGSSFANDSIAGVVHLSIVYTFTKGGKCHISHNFKVLQKITILDCGFMQSVIMSLSGYSVKRYIPHVLAKGGFDFKNIVDMTSYSIDLLFGTADYIDAAKPPNRFVDWLKDGSGNSKAGFTMGYIVDKTNSKTADRVANAPNGWDARGTKKSYPIAMSGLTLNPGDYKTFMGYRNYLAPSDVVAATNINVVKDGKDTYVYLDYHTAVTGANVKLPNDIGKSITVVDSLNFTLLNDVVDSDGITFNITTTYGYAILKCN